MPPIDLNVPFHEKDDARRLGARWDAVRKTVSCQITQISHLSQSGCHGKRISTFEPPPILSRHRHACVGAAIEVRGYSVSFFLAGTKNGRTQMHSITNHYRNDFSKTTQSFYWMNHCEHCGIKQGDFELFEEFDTPARR
jgi:uncharacterized protein DUF5710